MNKLLLYSVLGSTSLFVGIMGTFGDTGLIFYGALLIGTGMVLSSVGFLVQYLTSSSKT